MPPIYTIGYEGVTVDDLIATLVAAKVRVLLDVRAVPLSRKPGFSKNKLAGRLAEQGIAYVGLKGLGTPAAGRDAARKGRIEEMRSIFTAHLESEAAIHALSEAVKIAAETPACLLCFEHAPGCCHRLIIAERMTALTGQDIVHLNPELIQMP